MVDVNYWDFKAVILRCGCCGYENDIGKWSLLEFGSQSGVTFAIGHIYDEVKDERNHIGRVDIYACPKCNTLTFQK